MLREIWWMMLLELFGGHFHFLSAVKSNCTDKKWQAGLRVKKETRPGGKGKRSRENLSYL
jgi:hypothetical protein